MTDAADFPLMDTWRRAQELADEIEAELDGVLTPEEAEEAKLMIAALRFYAEKAREQVNDDDPNGPKSISDLIG